MARVRFRNINPSGSFEVNGAMTVTGNTTLIQNDVSGSALIVSGTMEIVQAMIGVEIEKAKLTIQNLGTLGDTGSFNVIDLGGFF
jgi:hypothetical protein